MFMEYLMLTVESGAIPCSSLMPCCFFVQLVSYFDHFVLGTSLETHMVQFSSAGVQGYVLFHLLTILNGLEKE